MALTSDDLITLAAIALGCAAGGCAVTIALQRWSGLEHGGTENKQRVESSALLDAVNRVAPQSATSREESELALARSGTRMTTAELWALRLVLAAVLTAGGFMVSSMAGASAPARVLAALAGCAAGALLPQMYLLYSRKRWQDDIERELPGALDLLCLTVMAGSTFESGVRTVSTRTTGALADSLKQVVAASAFSSMTHALGVLADNAGVKTLTVFVASLKQAEETGMAVADILRSQAESIRATRRIQVEEQINKLPMKMTFPIMLIFAAFMLLIMAPLLMSMVETLSGIA